MAGTTCAGFAVAQTCTAHCSRTFPPACLCHTFLHWCCWGLLACKQMIGHTYFSDRSGARQLHAPSTGVSSLLTDRLTKTTTLPIVAPPPSLLSSPTHQARWWSVWSTGDFSSFSSSVRDEPCSSIIITFRRQHLRAEPVDSQTLFSPPRRPAMSIFLITF